MKARSRLLKRLMKPFLAGLIRSPKPKHPAHHWARVGGHQTKRDLDSESLVDRPDEKPAVPGAARARPASAVKTCSKVCLIGPKRPSVHFRSHLCRLIDRYALWRQHHDGRWACTDKAVKINSRHPAHGNHDGLSAEEPLDLEIISSPVRGANGIKVRHIDFIRAFDPSEFCL